MERYEKIFLGVSVAMLVVFLGALSFAAIHMGIHLPSSQETITVPPGKNLAMAVLTTPPFNSPGVTQTGPGKYEAVILAQTWFFYPNEIKVPAGSEVTFRVTSVDVTHGFFIPGTTINMMVIPGHISVASYKFDKPGNYLLLCHEYCGVEHQSMYAKVEVQ